MSSSNVSRLFLALALFCLATAELSAQALEGKLTIKAAIVDSSLNVKPLPKQTFIIERKDSPDKRSKISTSFDGRATLSLPAGDYTLSSDAPLEFESKRYAWQVEFKIEAGKETVLELSNDNAIVTELPALPKRRVTEEAALFARLRDGVVTVEGELGHGTGFIIDERGLVLTNQHVISTSREVRVQFDRRRKVRANVLEQDADKDIAVLWINLEACSECRPLKLAQATATEPVVVEGERVFAIGSPLNQEKILTSGIVSKVEKRAIISDINVNPGNSGGPLFNSLGEVIGITTFRDPALGGPGVAGIVRIEEALALIDKARVSMEKASKPSAELLPTEPERAFPVDAIKKRVDVKKFETKPYKMEVGRYDVRVLTPVFKFYLSEKDRLESAREREKRNKEGAQGTVDKFQNLRNWTEYVGQLKPVVELLAIPEYKVTGKSMFLSGIVAATTGVSIPPDVKLKADFYEMQLVCNGEPVTPIRRQKVEYALFAPSYFKMKTRYSYAGLYAYPHDVFNPNKCQRLELRIHSEENPQQPDVKLIPLQTMQRVWSDFEEYRQEAEASAQTPSAP